MTIEDQFALWAAERAADGVRRALPPVAYTSPEMLALERERLFGKGWITVAHISELANPGDYVTFEIAGHPVVAVRGRDGELRAFSNVCPHRSAKLVEDCGHTNLFTCPYHAWSYDLTGKLMGAPYMDKAALKGIGLAQLALEVWQGLVFVSLDPKAAPLAPQLAELEPRFAPYRLADQRLVIREDLEIACNWKVLIENFCESYHLFCVHPETLEDLTPTATLENHPGGALFNHHTLRDVSEETRLKAERLGLPPDVGARDNLMCIYPALAMSLSTGTCLFASMMPDGPDRMRARLWFSLMPGESGGWSDEERAEIREGVFAFLDEDIGIIENIQQGLTTGMGNKAPLHPWEASNWEFACYLVRELGIDTTDLAA